MPEVRNKFVNWTFQNSEKRKPAKRVWESMITTFVVEPMPVCPRAPQPCHTVVSKMDLAYVLN